MRKLKQKNLDELRISNFGKLRQHNGKTEKALEEFGKIFEYFWTKKQFCLLEEIGMGFFKEKT